MKIAIVLQGISFKDNKLGISNLYYDKCKESFYDNVIEQLKAVFNNKYGKNPNIDIFLVTYNNSKIIDIIRDYKAKDLIIMPKIYLDNLDKYDSVYDNYLFPLLIEKSLEITEDCNYDYILLTRFDLFFYKPIDFSKINLDKCIFGYKDQLTQCDINFILCHRKYIYDIVPYIKSKRYIKWLNKVVGDDNVEYISKDINTTYELPDFYIIL